MQVLVMINVDDMNLSEYIIRNFDKYFDLTDGRLLSLTKLMKAYNGHLINVGQFKLVFNLSGFTSILEFIGNMDNFDTLVNYGNICLSDYQSQLDNNKVAATIKM